MSVNLNKLIHGDCIEQMQKLIDEDLKVNCVLTDLPFNVVNRESNGLRDLDKDKADLLEFELIDFIQKCWQICSGSFYIFCSTEQVSDVRSKFVELGASTRHCIWEKTNPSPMNGQHMWLSSIENCVYAKKPKATFNEHCKSSVWKFPNGTRKHHPTGKNQKLFNYLVETSTNENDLVLDPLMGSGTTGVACKNLNRNFIGIEKDSNYFKIAKERVENA